MVILNSVLFEIEPMDYAGPQKVDFQSAMRWIHKFRVLQNFIAILLFHHNQRSDQVFIFIVVYKRIGMQNP